MTGTMPKKSNRKKPPLKLGDESIGRRLARLRKQQGVTQVELAKKIGSTQALISAYERDAANMSAETIVRIAQALGVTTDALLCLDEPPAASDKISRKVMRRIQLIEELPPHKQRQVFVMIDALLERANP